MNDTLVDSNSNEEFVLDITGIHDEKFLDKQGLSGCYHSEIHLNEDVAVSVIGGKVITD